MYRNKAYRLGVLLSSLAVILVPHPTRAAIRGFRSGSAAIKQLPRSTMATVHAGRRNSRGCECAFDSDRPRWQQP